MDWKIINDIGTLHVARKPSTYDTSKEHIVFNQYQQRQQTNFFPEIISFLRYLLKVFHKLLFANGVLLLVLALVSLFVLVVYNAVICTWTTSPLFEVHEMSKRHLCFSMRWSSWDEIKGILSFENLNLIHCNSKSADYSGLLLHNLERTPSNNYISHFISVV